MVDGGPAATAISADAGAMVMPATGADRGHCRELYCSPVADSHTSTLPSQPPAATSASSLDHATLQMVARVRVVSVATGAPDEVLHRRMQASDDAAAIRDALGLKCTLVMQDVWPVSTATACVCVSHSRSEESAETEKAQVRTGIMCQGKKL